MFIFTSSFSTVAQRIDIVKNGLGKALFIKTAAEIYEGNPDWLQADREILTKCSDCVLDFSFTNQSINDVKEKLESVDTILLSGGNTFYLMNKIRQVGIANYLKELGKNKIIIGSSAGSVVFCTNLEPIKFFDNPDEFSGADSKDKDGIGLLDFLLIPHINSSHGGQALHDLISFNSINYNQQLLLISDDNYLIYDNSIKFF